mmetsp:Transcript_18280/g.37045  ORF Transcript_18280/g.37045 Transcript_18280/m.37045 type:complete len:135 (+) Transcript_18280:1197-1601(+)
MRSAQKLGWPGPDHDFPTWAAPKMWTELADSIDAALSHQGGPLSGSDVGTGTAQGITGRATASAQSSSGLDMSASAGLLLRLIPDEPSLPAGWAGMLHQLLSSAHPDIQAAAVGVIGWESHLGTFKRLTLIALF